MTTEEYFDLSEERKNEVCQNLNPYEKSEWEIFKTIERKFITEYKEHEAITDVFCGLAASLGPYNAITITIKKGKKRLITPKTYCGFPILKNYESSKKKSIDKSKN
jgi:hypothetical protein